MTQVIGTDEKPLSDDEIKAMQALTRTDGFNDAMDCIEKGCSGPCDCYRSRLPLLMHNEEYDKGWSEGCRSYDLWAEHMEQEHKDGSECDCY